MTQVVEYVVQAVSLGGLYALFALGIALIFGIGRIVNFAHGQIIALSCYLIVWCGTLPWPITVLATIAAASAIAVGMETMVFRPARLADESTLLIISFALALAIEALVLLLIGATPRSTSFGLSLGKPVHVGSVPIPRVDLLTVAVAAGLLGGLVFLLRRTPLGVRLRAAAEDFEMARLVGVAANGTMAATFALGGMLAGVAALLIMVNGGIVTPDIGFEPVLIAFIATVIGGMGSLSGAVAGGFLLGALTVVLQAALPEGLRVYRDALLFGLVIGLLVFRPGGLALVAERAKRI